MQVQYDLSRNIASTDFYTWMVMAAGEGATEIVFNIERGIKTDKWPEAIVQRRFQTLLWPGPEFLGLKRSIGVGGAHTRWQPRAQDLVQYCKAGKKFPRLKTVLSPAEARYTVTLRRDWRRPEKNSDAPVWREFAKEIGAVVIEDYDDDPKEPEEIMALYAGAEMNFGVNSGQFWLCALSPYPYMVFDCHDPAGSIRGYFVKYGVSAGSKWPWFNENQFIIWERETPDAIRRAFQSWKDTHKSTFVAAS